MANLGGMFKKEHSTLSAKSKAAEPTETWQDERERCYAAVASLDDGGWNALREVLRRGGFEKLYLPAKGA